MVDRIDIRSCDDIPGPGDIGNDGGVWMWDSGREAWVRAFPSWPKLDREPWLPGWMLPIPPQGGEVQP